MPIVVHTMGKVASVAVMQALEQRGSRPTHLHYGFYPEGEFVTATQLKVGAKIHKDVDFWRIITLVRKPIWRNLSAYFHTLKSYHGLDYYDYESLRNSFLYNYNHAHPENWFRHDWHPLYRFDLLSLPFDPDKGYAVYRVRPSLEVLVIRTEDLNLVAAEAFQEAFNMADFEMGETNKTRSDWYPRMKAELTLPRHFIKYSNNFDWAKHFYTQRELDLDYEFEEQIEEDNWVDARPERS